MNTIGRGKKIDKEEWKMKHKVCLLLSPCHLCWGIRVSLHMRTCDFKCIIICQTWNQKANCDCHEYNRAANMLHTIAPECASHCLKSNVHSSETPKNYQPAKQSASPGTKRRIMCVNLWRFVWCACESALTLFSAWSHCNFLLSVK